MKFNAVWGPVVIGLQTIIDLKWNGSVGKDSHVILKILDLNVVSVLTNVHAKESEPDIITRNTGKIAFKTSWISPLVAIDTF